MTQSNHSNIAKLLHIVSGFLLGQGSFFLALSYLAFCKEFLVIAQVSLGLSILSLSQWIADGGGTYLLRDLKRSSGTVLSFILVRLIQSIVLSVVLVFIFNMLDFGEQFNDIAIFSTVCAVIWAFNLTGVIDKSGKNKIAGPISGLSWVLSSIAVLLFYKSDNYGLIVGVAFSIGLMITVLYHHILLDFDFRRMFFDRVSLEDFKVDFNLVFFYNLNFSITQIYGRSLGFIVNYYLSASTAGLFLYARSASNAVSQILLFSRRVEFDNEVYSINFRSLLKFQKLSVALSIAAFSGALFLTLVLNYYGDEDFYLISLYLLLTLFSLIVWNFSNSLSMILVKFELVDKVAFISLITISIQIGFLLIFTPIYGIYTLFVSEVVLFLVQGLLFLFVAKKNFKKREVSIHG
jgi:hypothetical protein